MVLVLVIGDMHVPSRAHQIPAKFKALLVPGKIHTVFCTGNLCTKEMYDYLRGIATDVHVVRGEFDEGQAAQSWPESKVVQIEKFRIGMCHGHNIVPWGDHDALAMVQRQLDCDILITGHTHNFESFEKDGKFFINPGSATGAFSPCTPDVVPSFVLMDIQGDHIGCYLYRLIDGNVVVARSEYKAAPQ